MKGILQNDILKSFLEFNILNFSLNLQPRIISIL